MDLVTLLPKAFYEKHIWTWCHDGENEWKLVEITLIKKPCLLLKEKHSLITNEIELSGFRCNDGKQTQEISFTITRPTLSQYEFDQNYEINTDQLSIKSQLIESSKDFQRNFCSRNNFYNFLCGKFPFIFILYKYKWKECLLEDLITGIIVGIMHIPQGMAYSQLAGLRPVHGLYVSLFPALIYFFFGTSKHISIGSMAIASLMTNKFLEKSLVDFPIQTVHNITTDYDTANNEFERLVSNRAAGFAFFVGLTQILMGMCNMGSLTKYLSDPIISGFTVGSSVHVFTSQIKYCFGVEIQTFYGIFNVINTITEVIKNISETNIPTMSMAIICISLLIFTKEAINPYVMLRFRIPVPMELFVVVGGILASEYFSLHKNHKVLIVGEISKGLPSPTMPDIKISYNYVIDIIITGIIAFAVSVSLADIFSKKHGYSISSNQEFLAYGMMNVFASFFACFPSAASLSRSAVQESVGGKSQLSSLISSILLVFVLLFIGQFFENLPNCILASIIIVALKGLFMKCAELKDLWRFSLMDFSIWLITFLGTVILDVEYGLLVGTMLSIFSVVLKTQNPKSHILGQINKTDIYCNISLYSECKEILGIKIFQYEGSVYYASCENFKKNLYQKIGLNPREIFFKKRSLENKLATIQKKFEKENQMPDFMEKKSTIEEELDQLNKSTEFSIIIDCSNFQFIDAMGMKTINQVIEEYQIINISVFLTSLKYDIRKKFHQFNSPCHINDKMVYLSIHDAVVSILRQRRVTDVQM